MKYINDNQELKLDDIILNQSKTSLDYRHDVIVCKSKLNHCLAAFLDDSFMVTDNNQIVSTLTDLKLFLFNRYIYIVYI